MLGCGSTLRLVLGRELLSWQLHGLRLLLCTPLCQFARAQRKEARGAEYQDSHGV